MQYEINILMGKCGHMMGKRGYISADRKHFRA